jgi:hypothetical protein
MTKKSSLRKRPGAGNQGETLRSARTGAAATRHGTQSLERLMGAVDVLLR